MENKKIFILVAIIWIVLIGGFVAVKEYTLKTGQEVLLKTTPVDPRDLFRGDYVVLRYDISNIPRKKVVVDGDFKTGDMMYVILDHSEKYAIPVRITKTVPINDLYIRGILKSSDRSSFNIEYGIESYFVPEGEGKQIERNAGRNLDVKVVIDKFGKAVIKVLIVNGQEIKFK